MKWRNSAILWLVITVLLSGVWGCGDPTQEAVDQQAVQEQQAQYAKGQPIPFYDWSLERDLVIKLYDLRNERVATHSVWRGDMSVIEGDCPSIGFGIPYDTSLTNPLQLSWSDDPAAGVDWREGVIGQAEPNGVFASTNTSATWVMCVGDAGIIEPHYIESKVTVYPGPVEVDYAKNRVIRSGKATVTLPE
jgi:hypothetical protein